MKRLILVPLLAALAGCPTETPEPEVPPIDLETAGHAEGTNDLHAMLPWPSDAWLVEDDTTTTGLRLEYDEIAVPRNRNGDFFDPTPYRRLDGFSPASQPMTTFGAPLDMSNLAAENEWDESLAPDSPTLLVNLTTGERVAHFIQNDLRVEELDPGTPTMVYLHPAARLMENTTYGIAFRSSAQTVDGPITAHPVFVALRDGTITTNPAIEARRANHERLFTALEADGVSRSDLVAGWTFHTASGEAITREIVSMRDDAMERVPVGAGECVVDDVDVYQEEPCDAQDADCQQHDQLRYRIYGTFRAPLYMERLYPPTLANRDPVTDMPAFNEWHDVSFTMIVPHVAYEQNDARFVTYGHGLMGSQGEVKSGFSREMASKYNMVLVAADMHGMSEWDIVSVGNSLADMSKFVNVTERLMQGVVNWLVMTRSFMGACSNLPDLADFGAPPALPIDTDQEPYYIGISQGSIAGMVYAGLSQDIRKAAVLVGGQNYSVMIPRSSNFPDYEQIFIPWYERRLDQQLLLAMIMSLWDKSEPNAFVPHLLSDPLPNTPVKQILKQIAVNDSQVPNLSSDQAARTMGIPLLTPTSKDVWGLPTVTDADGAGSAMVYYDFDRPLGAEGNVPPESGNDVHGDQRYLEAAQMQMDAFLRPDGVITDFCAQDDAPGCSPE